MPTLPASVLKHLLKTTVADRAPAYLCVSPEGRLNHWGGPLPAYGIENLQSGQPIAAQVLFLEGLLPLDGTELFLPHLKTDSGGCTDVYLFSDEACDWVVLLDATANEQQTQQLQQCRNQIDLLRSTQAQAMSEPSLQQVLTALNLVVLERLDRESFQIVSAIPNWYRAFFPELGEVGSTSDRPGQPSTGSQTIQPRNRLGSVFPFLDNFLIDAEAFWQGSDRSLLKSGFWSEINPQGQEYRFEATAVCGNPHPILLIEQADMAYAEKEALLQASRINALNHAQFARETEKKEILLHCIFHDLAGQSITFRFCLELLRREALSERGRSQLETGLRQVQQQENLIREIVKAFSAELAEPQVAVNDRAQAPDLLVCARTVASTFLPAFTLQNKQLQLQIDLDSNQRWPIIGERSRLERVIANLLENALRHTPEQSTVTLTLEEEPLFLRCTIADQGAGVPPESVKYLFQRLFQGKAQAGQAGLGLYFCRITVEQWGGAIGYSPTSSGGAQFWLRLRKLL